MEEFYVAAISEKGTGGVEIKYCIQGIISLDVKLHEKYIVDSTYSD